MKQVNIYSVTTTFLIVISILFYGCDTGVEPDETRPVGLYGTIVDDIGNPISEVNVHYIFNPGMHLEIQSVLIQYSLPYTQVVTVKVYDIFDRLIVTLIDEVEQQPGAYAIHFNEPVTNGIYYFKVQKADTVESGKYFIYTEDITILEDRNPLLKSDEEGKFFVEPFAFGIGNTIMGVTISDSLSIVLTKTGYNTTVESFKLDTTQAVDREFIMKVQ